MKLSFLLIKEKYLNNFFSDFKSLFFVLDFVDNWFFGYVYFLFNLIIII